jgi:uncharacterized protein (DUF169 family)
VSSLNVLHEYGESLEELLRLRTFPMAFKFLEKEEDIPVGAKRPRRDYGFRFISCQGFSESRRAGFTIAQTKEDMWCFEPAMGYGFIEPIEYFLEGNNRFPEGASSLEAGKVWAQAFPRLPYGKYKSIVTAPLTKANFEPDMVIIYCDSLQLTSLLCARNWIDGHDIMCRMSGHSACVYATVPVMQTGDCQVASPCRGDRRRAGASDNEMIFSAPIGKIGGLVAALKAEAQYGFRIPLIPSMPREPEMLQSYMKIAKMTGMHE